MVGTLRLCLASFTKRASDILHIPTPVCRQQPTLDIAMETTVWPIRYARNVPMFYWIEMNVIDMTLEIRIIANAPNSGAARCLFPA